MPTTTEAKQRLTGWRHANGLSRREVADLAGITEQYVAHLENGQRNPSAKLKIRMARALGARVADLFEPPEG